jgi:hypothetical protein
MGVLPFLEGLQSSWRLLIPLATLLLSRKMGLIGYSIYCIVRFYGRLGWVGGGGWGVEWV